MTTPHRFELSRAGQYALARALRGWLRHAGPAPPGLLREVEALAAFVTRRAEACHAVTMVDATTEARQVPEQRELLSTDEVAEVLGVSARTVKRRIADGSLASVKHGGLRQVRRGDLDRYIDQLAA